VINVLSSHVVIACGIGPGTLSEIALALKFGKPLILMDLPADLEAALVNLSSAPIAIAPTVTAAIAQTQNFLTREGSNG